MTGVSLRQVLVVAIAAVTGACLAIAWGSHAMAHSKDDAALEVSSERIVLRLNAEQRAHISTEMLDFLEGLQTLSYALAEEDRVLIETTASELSHGAGKPIGRSILKTVPPAFRQTARGLRTSFSELSDAAEHAPLADLQLQVSTIIAHCSACHSAYAVVPSEP